MTIADQINRVIRRVTSADDAHTVTLEQHFATTPADLWSACTDPLRLGRWFEPVDGDLRQGGRYRLTGSGTEGTIETCESPTCLRITWEYGGDISRVAVTILDTGQGAALHLEHAMSDNEH